MSLWERFTENPAKKLLRHARDGDVASFNGTRRAYPELVPDFSGVTDFTSYWRLGECDLRGVKFTDTQAMQLLQVVPGGFNRWRKDNPEFATIDLREQGAFTKLDVLHSIDNWRGVLLSEAQQVQLKECNPRVAKKYYVANLVAGVAEGADARADAATPTPASHGVAVAGAQVGFLTNDVDAALVATR
ncbi:MAG: hypothetical protein SFW64_00885 [Alphaproteobacteria bacterium]|nr:hypothetical protein [Alphaproteobacteria bacterium]